MWMFTWSLDHLVQPFSISKYKQNVCLMQNLGLTQKEEWFYLIECWNLSPVELLLEQ